MNLRLIFLKNFANKSIQNGLNKNIINNANVINTILSSDTITNSTNIQLQLLGWELN